MYYSTYTIMKNKGVFDKEGDGFHAPEEESST